MTTATTTRKPRRVRSEPAVQYAARPAEDDLILNAMAALRARLRVPGRVFGSPGEVKDYLILRLAELPHEVFGVLWLDNQHAIIADDELFRGTIDGASVYPREVVKAGLTCNAAAAIFYHNHPSGLAEPSQADQRLTQRLKAALGTVDFRLLDHIIVGGTNTVSFAERGLL